MARSKVLILGGSSSVGLNLIHAMKNEDILFTYNNTEIAGGLKFDALSMSVDHICNLNEIKTAVILIGEPDPDICFKDPVVSENINVDCIKKIIDCLANYQIKIIFTSSEYVYGGKSSNNEESNVDPILLYGKQKIIIENYIEKYIKNYTILRLGKCYGSRVGDGTLFTSWYHAVKTGVNDITCSDDQYFSPIHYDDISKVIKYVAHSKTQGIYNLGGPLNASRLDFLQIFLDEYGKNDVNIITCSIDSFKLEEKRPKDVSMDSSKIIHETQFIFKQPRDAYHEIIKRTQNFILNKNCQVCDSNKVKLLIDFGLQPLSNRYGVKAHDDDYYNSLNLGQCQNCGLIQLIDIVPASEITPRVNWLKYNEPEEHLDELSDFICALKNLPENPVACGISYKDDSLLERLEERLFKKTSRINPEQDLGIKQKGIAGETVIPKLNPNSVKKITNKYGYFDVIIARHVLEHALDTQFFLSTVSNMLKPGGYIIFEVPDCTKQLQNKDFTMIWEEHILYFVPETFKSSFDHTSYCLTSYHHYPYKKEDVQVAIIKKDTENNITELQALPEVLLLAEEYAKSFENDKKIIHSFFKRYLENVGKIAFYGAGHDAAIFINIFQIEEFIEFIIDDTVYKQNLYLAGTSLKIKSSKHLGFENISLCILCLNNDIQDLILKKHYQFTDEGGIFVALNPMKKNSLINLARNNFKI